VLLPSMAVPVHLLMAVNRCSLSAQTAQTLKKAKQVCLGCPTDAGRDSVGWGRDSVV